MTLIEVEDFFFGKVQRSGEDRRHTQKSRQGQSAFPKEKDQVQ